MPEADLTPIESRHCVKCEPGTAHLDSSEIGALLGQLDGWTVEETDGLLRLAKPYKFKGFMPGVEFVNRIAPVAEAEGHHPDLLVSYGSVTRHLLNTTPVGVSR